MKLGHHGSSATIYTFPVNRVVRTTAMRELDALERRGFDSIVDTDSWYHQEAIEEKDVKPQKTQ